MTFPKSLAGSESASLLSVNYHYDDEVPPHLALKTPIFNKAYCIHCSGVPALSFGIKISEEKDNSGREFSRDVSQTARKLH